MRKSRLEAFSDGVIAILITNMVLELKVPRGTSLADLAVAYSRPESRVKVDGEAE
jgi:uncharacterized membrane protein